MTNKQLRNLYKQYNKKYFGNKLPKDMTVKFATRRDPLQKYLLGGAFWRKNTNGVKRYYKIVISHQIGSVVDKQTLLHEMIHILIGPKYDHGPRFVKEIKRLARAGAYDKLL